MGLELGTIALIGIAASTLIGGATAGFQIDAQERASKLEKRKQKLLEGSESSKRIRSQRKALREKRIRQAQILNQSAVGGTGESSAEVGVISSLETRFGNEVSNANQDVRTASAVSDLNQRSVDINSQVTNVNAFGRLSQSTIGSFVDFKLNQ